MGKADHFKRMELPPFTWHEERANFYTHAPAAAAAVVGTVWLFISCLFRGDMLFSASSLLYGITLILTLSSSAYYHWLPPSDQKRLMRLIDHLCIYLLIAGSYTPFALGNLRHTSGWFIFALIWGIAALGWGTKIAVLEYYEKYEKIDPLIYTAMGFLAFFFFSDIKAAIQPSGIFWLAIGGFSYIVGIVFYSWQSLRYHHAIWHLFVIGGAFSHFWAVYRYANPPLK